MDSRKIVLSCYLVAGILVWFLTRATIQYFYLTFFQIRRLAGITALRELIPVVLGAVTFAILYRNPRINTLLDEVVGELRKVTWPSRDDVVKSTTVVIVCIVVASLIFAGFDVVWGRVITFLLHS